MINITRTCDICGKDSVKINVKYKTRGLLQGFRDWECVDICDNCIDEIRKAVREKRERLRNGERTPDCDI